MDGEEGEKTTNFTIRLPFHEYEQLRRIATVNHTTISALIRKSIRDLLTDYTGEPTLSQIVKEINQLRGELGIIEARMDQANKNVQRNRSKKR